MIKEVGGKRCTCNAHRSEKLVEEGRWKGYTSSECDSCGNTVYLIELSVERGSVVFSPVSLSSRSTVLSQEEISKKYELLFGLGGPWDGCAAHPVEHQEKANRDTERDAEEKERKKKIGGKRIIRLPQRGRTIAA